MQSSPAVVDNEKVVAVVGPTASGKSELAVRIAETFGGEVVSADSRQVYRGMDIGSNKITLEEMRGIPHHLLDVADPTQQFTVADYRKRARETVGDILSRGKLPIACGGTWFYIDALLYDTTIPPVPPQADMRTELQKKSVEELYEELVRLDPRRASTIEAKNKRRLIRALEIVLATGKPVPPLNNVRFREPHIIFVAPHRTRGELKERIAARADMHMENIIEETKRLHDKQGLSWERLDSFGLEYRYAARFLRGMLTKEEALARLVAATWRYAKRQLAWCKKHPLHWVTNAEEAISLVHAFLVDKT